MLMAVPVGLLRQADAAFVALRRRWPEPCGERVGESFVGFISHPRHVSIRPDQDGSGSRDLADNGKLPRAKIFSIDDLNPISPWRDVEVARLTEVE